jgi:membrane associated rhomboid family serine protease
MLPPAGPEDNRAPDESATLVVAGTYSTLAEGFEHGLVILAMGRSFWLIPAEGAYRLMVEPPDLGSVRDELDQFDRESAGWPPPPPPIRSSAAPRGALFVSLCWAAAEVAAFGAQLAWPGRLEAAGALDSRAILAGGEWWRPLTALFLHADAGHLLSNLISGFFVLFAVLACLGLLRGGLLLAAAAGGGNLAVAAAYYPDAYQSLGASTGIFGGLGLLTGRALRSVLRPGHPLRWQAVLLPLGSGLTLLGLYGAGEARVDVAAHAAGFLCGLILGFAAGLARDRGPESPPSAAPP